MENRNVTFFGENLRRLRISKNLSQEQLAEIIDVSPRIIYDYENGLKGPSLGRLMAIANIFDLPLDYFFRKNW